MHAGALAGDACRFGDQNWVPPGQRVSPRDAAKIEDHLGGCAGAGRSTWKSLRSTRASPASSGRRTRRRPGGYIAAGDVISKGGLLVAVRRARFSWRARPLVGDRGGGPRSSWAAPPSWHQSRSPPWWPRRPTVSRAWSPPKVAPTARWPRRPPRTWPTRDGPDDTDREPGDPGDPGVPEVPVPGGTPTSGAPSGAPTVDPTGDPTAEPTGDPTAEPTGDPTAEPTGDPTAEPTGEPTADPTGDPTSGPTGGPTAGPDGRTQTSRTDGLPRAHRVHTGSDHRTHGPDHRTHGPDHRTHGPDHRTDRPDHRTHGPDHRTDRPRPPDRPTRPPDRPEPDHRTDRPDHRTKASPTTGPTDPTTGPTDPTTDEPGPPDHRTDRPDHRTDRPDHRTHGPDHRTDRPDHRTHGPDHAAAGPGRLGDRVPLRVGQRPLDRRACRSRGLDPQGTSTLTVIGAGLDLLTTGDAQCTLVGTTGGTCLITTGASANLSFTASPAPGSPGSRDLRHHARTRAPTRTCPTTPPRSPSAAPPRPSGTPGWPRSARPGRSRTPRRGR